MAEQQVQSLRGAHATENLFVFNAHFFFFPLIIPVPKTGVQGSHSIQVAVTDLTQASGFPLGTAH